MRNKRLNSRKRNCVKNKHTKEDTLQVSKYVIFIGHYKTIVFTKKVLFDENMKFAADQGGGVNLSANLSHLF